MRKGLIAGSMVICIAPFSTANADGYLEIPQVNSFQSGVGLVSGWHCNAGRVDIQIDGGRFISTAYGTERADTQSVCGDANNGFSFLINYSGLSNGVHTIKAYADGDDVPFGSSSFYTQNLGQEFVRGLTASFPLENFPAAGQTSIITWQEANQNFIVTDVAATASIIPQRFSREWLSGQTLYNVWYGVTNDTEEARGRVGKTVFNQDGIATMTGVYNLDNTQSSIGYQVDANGLLTFNDFAGYYYICETHPRYFIACYENEENGFSGKNVFFFNEMDALDAANLAELLYE
ncbi:hypothetical protein [Thiospirillum jenense]|uniref:Uncharacterized protein n=1 Tax=Thiospirillum jenense TaxID=1653858 RepID=A0A839HJI4_9GAMM|nr:hypothetical protein [Thiospirillum jenense]MBB1126917.1 hypothetical protein [Thiospirillum jenense]